MKYKALESFSGLVSMYKGEIRDFTDSPKDLIDAGYVEAAEKGGEKVEKDPENK